MSGFSMIKLAIVIVLLVCLTDGTQAAISCYSRFATTSSSNGSTISCSIDNFCYSYTSGDYSYAGCGTCTSTQTTYYACTSCSTNLCNTKPASISCYYSTGDYLYTSRTRKTCTVSSCYEYSYGFGSINFFFAGCGTCSLYSSYTNCRSCTTNYCNSGHIVKGQWTVAASAVIAILALIKAF